MGKIVISTNMTLDGVVQDPDGKEGSSLGGWFRESAGEDFDAWGKAEYDEVLQVEALLLGRRSDEWFAARSASRTGQFADRLNSMPKYVVSSTIQKPQWTNATVLRGDLVNEVSKLKQDVAGDILVYASYQLGRALIARDLADSLRLTVFPVILGAGERFFAETSEKKPMRAAATKTIGAGIVSVTYQFAQPS
jgi:dihydrofolate reductase